MKKVKVVIPSSLQEVTLGQYQQYAALIDGLQEGEYNENEVNKQILSIFTMVSEELLGRMPHVQVMEALGSLTTTLSNTDSSYPLITKIKQENASFGFIPNLEEMSFDEYTDLDQYFGKPEQAHRFMAVCYRPIVAEKKWKGSELYEIEEYESTEYYCEAMKLVPLSTYLGAVGFFDSIGIQLLQAIPSYLEKQMASKEVQDHLKDLQQSGSGIELTTNSVQETLQKYKQLVS